MEQEIMETVLHDMLQDLEAIKEQKQHFVKLQNTLETQNEVVVRIEQKLTRQDTVAVTLTEEQLKALKEVIRQYIELLREDLMKHPITTHTYKHISLMPQSFRMEHFPMLVNTIMKWVVILIVLVFVIWFVVRFAD